MTAGLEQAGSDAGALTPADWSTLVLLTGAAVGFVRRVRERADRQGGAAAVKMAYATISRCVRATLYACGVEIVDLTLVHSPGALSESEIELARSTLAMHSQRRQS